MILAHINPLISFKSIKINLNRQRPIKAIQFFISFRFFKINLLNFKLLIKHSLILKIWNVLNYTFDFINSLIILVRNIKKHDTDNNRAQKHRPGDMNIPLRQVIVGAFNFYEAQHPSYFLIHWLWLIIKFCRVRGILGDLAMVDCWSLA